MDCIHTLPSIKETLRQYHFSPKKSLGQNFLLDANIAEKIAHIAGNLTEGTLIEIGPGIGSLTRALLLNGGKNVIGIEIDARAIKALQPLQKIAGDALCLYEQDATKIAVHRLGSPPRQVIGNLPYNVGTTLLLQWLETPKSFSKFTLMLQREVAHRITAKVGEKQYGRLSVFCNWLCHTNIEMLVKPQSFLPRPTIDSAVITLTPRPTPLYPCTAQSLHTVTKAAFGQRRKMIKSALKTLPVRAEALWEKANIIPTKRAEELTIKEFCTLANIYSAHKK